MNYNLIYHPEIINDIAAMPKNIAKRIKKAIENRLLQDPIKFGGPLRRSLQGLGIMFGIFRFEGILLLIRNT